MFKPLLITVLLISFVSLSQNYAQESKAYKKKGLSYKTPLLKPKYPSYNLAATYLLTQKAKRGDPFAQHELGLRYILGIGIPKDSVKAAYWIKKAAKKKLPSACFNFGIMLSNEIGVDWNPFEAFNNFKISAESGMAHAQYIVGLTYTESLVVNKDLQTAYLWLKKAADKDFEGAIKVINELRRNNLLLSIDSTTIVSEKKRNYISVKNNSNLSDYDFDYFDFEKDTLSLSEEVKYLKGILVSDKNKLKKTLKVENQKSENVSADTSAIGIINSAALSGSPEALLLNGRFFEYGIGAKKNLILASSNYLKAFRLGSYKAAELLLKISNNINFFTKLKKEIKNNNTEAMYVWAGLVGLGMNYLLTQDQALELLVKAKKQKHVGSIIELGLAYYTGSIVKKDTVKAIEYLEEAIKLGSSEAKVRLSLININNKKNTNVSREIKVLKKYANNGSVLAVAALAFCYENGLGVRMQKAKAAKLYRKAAQRGNEAAYQSLQKMYDQIRPSNEIFQIYFK